MLKIKFKHWLIFICLAFVGLGVWYKLTFPELAFINFEVDRKQAIQIADNFLKEKDIDPDSYIRAGILGFDGQTNRYLQKSIGFDGLNAFVKDNDYDLFFWLLRYYRENEKEEFRISISSDTGEINSFSHAIAETDTREEIPRDDSRNILIQELKDRFAFNMDNHIVSADVRTKHDNRIDYTFHWQKENVEIPWSDVENSGTGKLTIGGLISGEDILRFNRHSFKVPEQFSRFMNQQQNLGENLSAVVILFYYALFISSVFVVVTRRNHLAMHFTKKFYIKLMIFSFIVIILSAANNINHQIFNFSTTSPVRDKLWRFAIATLRNSLFLTVAMLIPGLAGELLHFENQSKKKIGSFLHYLRTSFFSRPVTQCILIGYCVFPIMLALQSILFYIGQKHLGVWVQYSWMGRLNSSFVPSFAAFAIGFQASVFEEVMYRLFAINFCKKIFKKTWLAVLISSAIWGFSHSGYAVFPMWFRGLEVTCLGILLSFVYLRYGLIAVIVAHYLFDVFWHTVGYLLGESTTVEGLSAIAVLLLPLLWAIIAAILNSQKKESPLVWQLSQHQKFNLEVLTHYLENHRSQYEKKEKNSLMNEIIAHGWDMAVVEEAVKAFFNKNQK